MADDTLTSENVIAVDFEDDSRAFEALSTLKELDGQGRINLVEAVIVTRGDDGQVRTKDEAGDDDLVGTASGGLIGLLIGILGGPLGVLIGGASGLLLGSLYDLADADDTDSVLGQMSKKVKVGRNTVLAQVVEQSPEVIDTAMTRLTGTVVREAKFEVADEIATAEEAQRKAKQEARKKLREERHKKRREDVDAKVDELKSKLHRDRKPTTTGS
jgi:uncharacterized membrane protein